MLLAELCLAGNACPALTPTQAGSSRAKEQLQNTGMGARMLPQSEGKGRSKITESQKGWAGRDHGHRQPMMPQ